jgi:hypothetical protein
MYKFQERDGDSPDLGETWTQFWHSHFSFFENREDAEEFYDEWKHVELELRHVPHHPRDKVKFADGKTIWARVTNGRLTSPDGREICVKFNIGGPRYCARDTKHGDNRAHLCSFCGAKDHHALSWTCRTKDA